jgi:succinate dehydrogenase/fumarate reductase-like Fe-S protein
VSSLEIEVLQEGADMRPGTRLALTQQRMEDGTWLLQELRGRLVIKPLRVMNVRKDLVMTRSDYHKFSVDSRIIDTQ